VPQCAAEHTARRPRALPVSRPAVACPPHFTPFCSERGSASATAAALFLPFYRRYAHGELACVRMQRARMGDAMAPRACRRDAVFARRADAYFERCWRALERECRFYRCQRGCLLLRRVAYNGRFCLLPRVGEHAVILARQRLHTTASALSCWRFMCYSIMSFSRVIRGKSRRGVFDIFRPFAGIMKQKDV